MPTITHPAIPIGSVWASNDARDIRNGDRQNRTVFAVETTRAMFADGRMSMVKHDTKGIIGYRRIT